MKTNFKPYPKYKDSGVEWLNEIPEHWEILPIKRITEIPITDGPHETPILQNEGIPFISAEAIKHDKIDFSKMRGYISLEDHIKFSKKYKPQKGDIYLIKSGATTGNIACVDTEKEFNIWSPLAAIRPNNEKILTYFMFFFMKSRNFFQSIETGWNYGTQQNISMNVIENISISLPTIKEQKSIAKFLDKKTSYIDSLIQKKEKQIELLKEYRSSLITSAVTGKINICESHEEKVVNISQFQKKEKETPPLFKKTVLGVEIVAQMKDHPHFGRTKFMKTLYLCEAHLGIPLKGEYKREAAGPLDHSIYKMEGIMKRNKWFGVVKKGSMFKYKALENSEGYKHYFDKYWKDYSKQLNQLILLVNKFTTEQSEIVDTIYAVWNDFLMDGKNPSDHEIIYEIKNNWHESKKRFSDEKLKKAINWMRKQSLIPKGHGPKTKGQ